MSGCLCNPHRLPQEAPFCMWLQLTERHTGGAITTNWFYVVMFQILKMPESIKNGFMDMEFGWWTGRPAVQNCLHLNKPHTSCRKVLDHDYKVSSVSLVPTSVKE